MGIEGSGASRAGGEGFHNEDAWVVEEGLGLYLVCDGASGTPAGEVAARLAATAVEQFVERAHEQIDRSSGRASRAVVEGALVCAIHAVAEAGRRDPALSGLATTVTVFLAHEDRGVIGHLGDSRAYLVRGERAHQLTLDHELTGSTTSELRAELAMDVFTIELERGDTIVLCTDGAEDVIGDPALMRVAASLSPRVLASRIVSLANRRRPEQDATAVVVRVRGASQPGWLELSLPPRGTAFGHTLERA